MGIAFRRQNLTTKVYPGAVRVKFSFSQTISRQCIYMTIVYHHRVSIHDEDGEEQSNGEQYEEGLVQNDSFINPLQPGYEGKQRINPLV